MKFPRIYTDEQGETHIGVLDVAEHEAHGKTLRLGPGGVIYRDDTSGKGHVTRSITDIRLAFINRVKRSCASWLIMRGRSLKEVQEILGHREFSMTLRYAHLSPDRLREAVAALEDFRNDLAMKRPMVVNSTPRRSQVREKPG